MSEKINIPSYLITAISEELGSDRIELIMKNGFRVIAYKKQFKDYEKFKQSVKQHAKDRVNSRKFRPKSDRNRSGSFPRRKSKGGVPNKNQDKRRTQIVGNSNQNQSPTGKVQASGNDNRNPVHSNKEQLSNKGNRGQGHNRGNIPSVLRGQQHTPTDSERKPIGGKVSGGSPSEPTTEGEQGTGQKDDNQNVS